MSRHLSKSGTTTVTGAGWWRVIIKRGAYQRRYAQGGGKRRGQAARSSSWREGKGKHWQKIQFAKNRDQKSCRIGAWIIADATENDTGNPEPSKNRQEGDLSVDGSQECGEVELDRDTFLGEVDCFRRYSMMRK